MAKARRGGGKVSLKTVAGRDAHRDMNSDKLVITDAKGDAAMVTIADVNQSNGVIHVVDKVLMP